MSSKLAKFVPLAAAIELCIFGDIFLEISDATFLAGLVAFLLGHVAYIIAFVGRSRELRPLEAIPFAVWVIWLAVVLSNLLARPASHRRLRLERELGPVALLRRER